MDRDLRRLWAIDAVCKERVRQEQLKEEGRFPYTAADGQIDGFMKLAILLSELGELADAFLQEAGLQSKTRKPADAKEEAAQVAAVAMAIVEGLAE